ncbi:MAG: cupin domain-containing protein [Acidobacteriota bacterium]
MKVHATLDTEAAERAALHVLGALGPSEAVAYEEHLVACATCRTEVETLRRTVTILAEHAPQVEPPVGLRDRLLARLDDPEPAAEDEPAVQAWRHWSPERAVGGELVLSATESGWEATGTEGVEARRLFVDPVAERVTMLIRMAPGSSYPAHRHGGPEECYVIEGDLDVGGTIMTAGSYQRLEEGSEHPDQSTENGCLLFIVSSLHDRLLPREPGVGPSA